ncbi:hypothetical protein GA0116948_1365 [Chitinophaga costaii]|uniref:Immunity protein 50 n=1 Tax=Chitinophaga costaii TaxID=1335309 RepID=A0A1C4GA79_9BACT|nr:hypothetical protein [Chitinophaga costaii]PUZ19247.1 hypothetical protein DCM91_20775 [Chitinophaga costaii]SCC64725.1 hypothetical protein GA0116948_1365 [Chitinophaga costaii]
MLILNETIEELRKLELHDQGINRIDFDFSKREITISFSVYEESASDHVGLIYEFSDVRSLIISQVDLKTFLDLEIHSHEVIARPEGDYSFRLEMLQGIGDPSSVIFFLFGQCRKL